MIIRWWYFVLAIVIIFIEVAIAIGAIPGQFIRNSVGDILAIALVYCVVRGLTTYTPISAALASVAVGFFVEALQYIHLVDLLHLQAGSVLAILIGNTFSVADLLMYAIGGLLAYGLDLAICSLSNTSNAK